MDTEYLKGRPIKFYVAVFVILAGTGLALYALLNYGLLSVVASSDSSDEIVLTIRDQEGGSRKKSIKSGGLSSQIVKRGAYQVSLTQNNRETLAIAEVKPLSKIQVSATVKPERAVSRAASGSLGCGINFGVGYHSYDCLGNSPLYRHTPVARTAFGDKQPISEEFELVQPYKKGLLRARAADEGEYAAEYFDGSSSTSIKVPSEITSPSLFVAQSNSLYEFGFYDSGTASFYLYRSLSDANPYKIKPSLEGDSTFIRTGHIYGNRLLVLYSEGAGHEGDDVAEHSDEETSWLATYSLAENKVTSRALVPSEYEIDEIRPWRDKFLGLSKKGLWVMSNEDGSLEPLGFMHDINLVKQYQNNLAVSDGTNIYMADTRTLSFHRVFRSENLSLSNISLIEDQLSFTAFPIQDRSTPLPDAYLVKDEAAIYPRAESHLPYADNDRISRLDYNDRLLRISLNLRSLSWNRQTGQPSYDAAEFAKERDAIIKRLREDKLYDRYEVLVDVK